MCPSPTNEPEMVAFSAIRGWRVVDASGRVRGRLFDIVFEPDGDTMVATQLVVVRNRLGLLGHRLRVREIGEVLPVSSIRSIAAGRIVLEDHHA